MKKRNFLSVFIYIALLALCCWLIIGLFTDVGNELPYSQVVELFREEQVKSCVMSDGKIYLELYNPYQGKTSLVTGLAVDTFYQEMSALLEEQQEAGILEVYDLVPEQETTYYELILPLLIVGLILLLVWGFKYSFM